MALVESSQRSGQGIFITSAFAVVKANSDNNKIGRALEVGLEMLPSGFRLLPVAPLECYERSAQGIVITSIFAAVETNPADKFSIGALGQWLPVPELLQKVSLL